MITPPPRLAIPAATDLAIMGHMAVNHEEVVISDSGDTTAMSGAAAQLMMPAPGGLIPWAGAALLLVAGLVWQLRRLRESISNRNSGNLGKQAEGHRERAMPD